MFYVLHILMRSTYLFMIIVVEELDSPANPEDFQDVDVKDEPFESDAVSCDLFYHLTLMVISIYLYLALIYKL